MSRIKCIPPIRDIRVIRGSIFVQLLVNVGILNTVIFRSMLSGGPRRIQGVERMAESTMPRMFVSSFLLLGVAR